MCKNRKIATVARANFLVARGHLKSQGCATFCDLWSHCAMANVPPETLRAVSERLAQTMSPDAQVRRPAEDFLLKMEGESGYGLVLLQLVAANDQQQHHTVVAAAVAFKNFIKRNWRVVSCLRVTD
jgi:hypothetical protein